MRLPGQSIVAEARRLWDDNTAPWLIVALFFVLFAAFEWFAFLRGMPRNPVVFTVAAGLVTVIAGWKLARAIPRMRQLRLGLEGEQAVGQFLEGQLGIRGYRVFHDIVGPDFNIDHVLIGPTGIYTVETKTLSKPVAGDARISFDGSSLMVAGRPLDRDPIRQAHAQAAWLRRLLQESTGRTHIVFPTVLFPGWFVEQAPGSLDRLWVLEPKALPAFLDRREPRLPAEDVHLIAFHLSRYVRSTNKGAGH